MICIKTEIPKEIRETDDEFFEQLVQNEKKEEREKYFLDNYG